MGAVAIGGAHAFIALASGDGLGCGDRFPDLRRSAGKVGTGGTLMAP